MPGTHDRIVEVLCREWPYSPSHHQNRVADELMQIVRDVSAETYEHAADIIEISPSGEMSRARLLRLIAADRRRNFR